MTILTIDLFDERHPDRSSPPWAGLAEPTHVANTNAGDIAVVVIARGMSSGRASVALRAAFLPAPEFPDAPGPVVVLELSADNVEAIAAAVRGVEARR